MQICTKKLGVSTFVLLFFHIFTSNCTPNYNHDQTHYTKIHYQFDPSTNSSNCLVLAEEILKKSLHIGNVSRWHVEKVSYPAVRGNSIDGDFESDEFLGSRLLEIFTPHESTAIEEESHPTRKEVGKYCDSVNYVAHQKYEASSRGKGKSLEDNILKLVDNGPSSNRIDVVFMGDGYTEKERPKFFADITRLVVETFYASTFSEFLPLLNIWAIFTPSTDSGISYPGRQKNTTFSLHRPTSGAPRGIYVRKKNAARATCRRLGPSACDYPIIIANDEYYGGIGGEFAVSTSSLTSGAMVLRHELGHNFARVGEEYDGGEVYNGVNSASSLQSVGWRAWLDKNSSSGGRGRVREERMVYRILGFPQNDLDKREVSYTFRSNGAFSGGGWILIVTLSGAEEPGSVQFLLDGETLPWTSRGTKDKSIYSWTNTTHPLSLGRHTLTISATDKAIKDTSLPLPHETRIPRSIGSVLFYEFGNPNEFQQSDDVISAYPTWNAQGRKSFRPTNNGCLMRNMSHDQLCSICKEEIWLQFLRRVSLIEDIIILIGEGGNSTTTKVTLEIIGLGQFRREDQRIEGERMEVRWELDGKERLELRDQLDIVATQGQRDWQVVVKLVTPRVRHDPRAITLHKRKFFIQ